jgi:PAS domain-containing protein
MQSREACREIGPAASREGYIVDMASLNLWRGRLQAAEAVLGAPSPSLNVIRKALRDAASALSAAVAQLDEMLGEVRKYRERVLKSEQLYGSLRDSIPIALVTTARDGQIVELNPDASILLSLSKRAAIGRSLLLFFAERESWLGVMRGLRDTDPPLRREITLRPREKAPRRCIVCVSPAKDDALHWYLLPLSEKSDSEELSAWLNQRGPSVEPGSFPLSRNRRCATREQK